MQLKSVTINSKEEIFLDGQRIENVSSYKLERYEDSSEPAKLTVTMYVNVDKVGSGIQDTQLTEKDLHCLARQLQSWSAPDEGSLNTSQRYYACVYCKYVHDCKTPTMMHQKKVLNKLRDLTGVDIFPGSRHLYWQFFPASRFLEYPEELPVLKEIHKDMRPDEYQDFEKYLNELISRSKEVSGFQQGSSFHKDS